MDRVDDRAFRRDNFDWTHQSGTRRHVVAFKQTAKHVGDGGDGDCFDGIDRAGDLRRAAAKVDARALSLDRDPYLDAHFSIVYAIVVERVLGSIIAVGNRTDSVAHEPGGVFDQMVGVFSRLAFTSALNDLQQARGAGFQRTNLRLKIAASFSVTANICQDQTHRVFIELTVSYQPNWRNAQAFAVNICGHAHRARGRAADEGMVLAVCDVNQSGQWAVGIGQLLSRGWP